MTLAQFEIIWKRYPRRLGRKAAERHFKASVKTLADFLDIQNALDHYLECREVRDGFIQYGKTWFNNWRDWVDYEDPVRSSQEKSGAVTPIDGKYANMEEITRRRDLAKKEGGQA